MTSNTEATGPAGPDAGAPAGVQPARNKSGHPQDGSQLQTVVEEQLFIETAKDDQFSEMPGDPRSQPPQRGKARQPAQGAAPASDSEPPENARESSPESAPEEPVEGLVLGNSGFPSRGN
jgi:hypothetical protein